MNRRVLIFSLAYFPVEGGAEIAVKEITDRLPDIEFDIVTLRFNKTHPAKERVGNVNVYRIGGGLGYLSKILFIPQATLFALRRKYDLYWVVMTYMLFPVVLGRLFGDRTPYVLTLQDGDPFEHVFARLRIFPFLPMLFYGFRRASKVQAISNYLAEWANKMGYKDKVEVIPNGVDVEKFQRPHPVSSSRPSPYQGEGEGGEVCLITTSRLVEKNGVGDIIESLKYLPENVHLKILGTGPLEEVLKLKVQSGKLGNRVRFLGHVPYEEIPKHLHDADIFIRPSVSEGFGNSFIEAMAAGVPVIATPVGGIPDFLENGSTGLFCEVNNPESIAREVKKLMSDKLLREKIINNAQKMVAERYDWNLIASEMQSKVFNI